MSGSATKVAAAREAFARRDWRAAYDGLRALGPELDTDDLDILSDAAWWSGNSPESMAVGEDVYQRLVAEGAHAEAADRAMRLALAWATRGDVQVAMAWLSRADRLLQDLPRGRAHGTRLYFDGAMNMDMAGDPGPAAAAAVELDALARELDDETLGCFARVLEGMALVRSGETARGFGCLDEAMLPVLAGRLDALWSGDIYCTTIHLCDQLGDLARMREWTDALARWANPLSRTFMYASVTRVHELQIISAEGDWDLVEEELGRESESLVGAHGWLSGAGFYELGDVRRLRGDSMGAAVAYDRARSFGVDPQPGAALMLRAAGRPADALAELRVSLADVSRLERAQMLLPAVELALEVREPAYAAGLAEELEETAAFFGTPGLVARAARARASVHVADGHPELAVAPLETAGRIYRAQRYRYAGAQVHELLSTVLRAVGDQDAADAELATALAVYRRLGATPDVDRLAPTSLPGGLTAREAEVLACVASGASNRKVAEDLVISDKTVSRHLASIFTKIGVTSRTAAAAWAREHQLV